MQIFVDDIFHCHVDDDGTRRAVECDFFNGKCREFIEGYCYNDSEGYVQVYPWKPYEPLAEIQNAVDRTQNEADTELAALIEQIYLEDLEVINNV